MLKNKKGFTLVELMVVVVIIGILTAIAIPVYNNVTAGAEANACKDNQRTIDSAIMMWSAGDGLKSNPIVAMNETQLQAALCPTSPTNTKYLAEWPECSQGCEYTSNASGLCIITQDDDDIYNAHHLHGADRSDSSNP